MNEILINVGVGETRVAHLVDGRLEEFAAERSFHRASLIGDIIYGRVQRVVPGMQAAFVDIGQERSGFLAAREAGGDDISACVQEGQALLVQVIKDAFGEKGPRLSATVTLPGRLLVLAPGKPGIALSRRIADETARATLKALGEQVQAAFPGMGFIIRSEAAGALLQDLLNDARTLEETWRGIEQQQKAAPVLLHSDLGPVERALRDWARADIIRVRIDDAAAADAARAYCRRAVPAMESRIEYAAPPLFDDALESQIEQLCVPRVALPSGGWITIEATEALTAIDVNSGAFTEGSGLADTSLSVNLEAAREIGRQLRLRGIGGLIVIDFIHLHQPGHAARVVEALSQSLAKDRAPVQISPMSEFGIVAVTRKRTGEPLARLATAPCAVCDRAGRRPTAQTLALEILRQVEREARANPGREVLVSAAPQVMEWLMAHEKDVRAGLARRGAGRVRFEAGEGFDVRAS